MAAGGPTSVIELLIVEDDPGDVLLTREALSGSQVPAQPERRRGR